jgi:hypothetical protein
VTLSFALNILIAALLVAVIVYAVILNRKLGGLRDHKADFEKLLAAFDESTKRAENSVKTLKASAEQQMKALQQPVQRAEAMRDELAFIVKRADEVAERLTNSISTARGGGDSAAKAQAGDGGRDAGRDFGRDSGRDTGAGEARRGVAPPTRGARQVARADGESAAEPDSGSGEGVRSKAETELLKALRGLR